MRKRFLHIGAMEKGKSGRWKFLQNEDVDIEDFVNTIANHAADRIGWISMRNTRVKEIKNTILGEIQAIIQEDSPVARKSKKKR